MTVSILLAITVLLFAGLFMYSGEIAVLNPKGMVALKERNLIIIAILLMLIIVVPIFIMTAAFAWKYRSGNTKAAYAPDWNYSLLAESIWWGVPLIIVAILSFITWRSSHELDPFKPIEMEKKSLTIQVVALQWKWLFLYPEQNIAIVI